MKQETATQGSGTPTKRRATWQYVLALLAVVGIVWFVFARVLPARRAELGEGSESPLVLAGKNTIAVNDQLFGDSVTIQSVNLANDSWLAVHEEADGKPGNILGAAWFPAGTSSGVIELQRPTVDGAAYYVMLHEDKQPRGEDGHKTFDLKIDVPMTDSAGNPLMTKFMATAHPAVQQ